MGRMAYARGRTLIDNACVPTVSPLLPAELETVAELRDLYRAAEARAARLRLLSEAGQQLAAASAETIDATLAACARRLAHFLGHPSGRVLPADARTGVVIPAPGDPLRAVAVLDIPGFGGLDAIADREDRDAAAMWLHMAGATIERITREGERVRLLAVLQEREKRLEDMVGQLFSAQEEERRRVSRELHDGVAQKAGALFRLLESASPPQPRHAAIAQELVRELRAVIGGLRPTILDDLGLEAALRALASGLAADGYLVEERLEPGPDRWPANLETAFYRIAQEACANIRKHAGGPCGVGLELVARPEAGLWQLAVSDRGAGALADARGAMAGADEGCRIGIAVMRERMAAVGGRLEWHSAPGAGTRVVAIVERAS